MASLTPSLLPVFEAAEVQAQAKAIFEAQKQAIYVRTDRLFAGLMGAQWAGAVAAACFLSPRTWAGTASQVHPHVLAAIFLGGLLSIFPICLALICPGRTVTRQVIAVSQLLMSALLIHVTGGRAATHFHIFGSLAFLAFYRDWRVLVSATLVTAADHLLRGMYWPQSVYGLAAASPWLTVEHVGWVAFEDVFLLISCRQSLAEMYQISLRQSELEAAKAILLQSNETLETQGEERAGALAYMRRQHQLLLDSAGEGIYAIDATGITQFVNPAAAAMLGYEIADLIGQPMHTLLHHTQADGQVYSSNDCPIFKSVHDGHVYRVDNEVFWRKDGTSFDVEYISTPLCEEGQIVGALVMFQDITERRQVAAALQQRERELSEALQEHQNVMDTVPDVLFRLDLTGRLVQWNRKMEMVTGLSPPALHGRSALDFFADAERKAIAQALRQALETGHVEVEGSLLRRDGTAILHQFSAVPLRDTNGELTGITGMARDITEQRRATEALRKSEERLRTLVENSPVLFYSYDAEGIYTLAEGSCLKLIGSKPGENVGLSVFDVYKDNPQVLDNARRVLSGETIHTTTQIKDLTFDARMQPLWNAQGKVTGAIGVATDITQQHRAEQKIYQLHADITLAYDAALNAYDATIEGWSRALDLRDHETEGHSRRVTEMTLRLAAAAGVPEDQKIHVRRGALLHDIGKMGVPDRILLKPGPLDDDEWEIMRRHPALAREMLAPTEFLYPALDIPYCHHEKWNGTGYPQGLRGTEIPLAARLFAMVDVWDALTSDRPYRSAWSRERVLDHLQGLAGSHFDPEIVPLFLRLLEAEARPQPLRLAA